MVIVIRVRPELGLSGSWTETGWTIKGQRWCMLLCDADGMYACEPCKYERKGEEKGPRGVGREGTAAVELGPKGRRCEITPANLIYHRCRTRSSLTRPARILLPRPPSKRAGKVSLLCCCRRSVRFMPLPLPSPLPLPPLLASEARLSSSRALIVVILELDGTRIAHDLLDRTAGTTMLTR